MILVPDYDKGVPDHYPAALYGYIFDAPCAKARVRGSMTTTGTACGTAGDLLKLGITTDTVGVEYEFQKGADRMLLCRRDIRWRER